MSRQAHTRLSEFLPRAFILEALDLLASYLFSREVELGRIGLGARDEGDEETRTFLRELEARHALASAMRFRELLPPIERRASSTSQLFRDESKGVIRGRLDLPRYLGRRSRQRFGPRTYPVIVTESAADTPENGLVTSALRGLARQLAGSALARSESAEGEATTEAYGWVRSRLRRLPWAAVTRYAPLSRLERESAQRIRKRQTGNDTAYGAVIEWLAEWLVDVARIGAAGRSRIVDGLLAFPVGDFFWNKVFEVWCLREVGQALARVGCTLESGPRPLHERGKGPIYTFQRDALPIEVWFQRQEPLGNARWRYVAGSTLVGVPDVVLSAHGSPPFLVDAKRRPERQVSQAEEIYKVLGYAENFQERFGSAAFRSVLFFPGVEGQRLLERGDGARLTVLFIPESARERTTAVLDAELRGWLGLPANLADVA